MKKVFGLAAILTMLCFVTFVSRAQDSANGEKIFKSKCAGCHGANAEGKEATKAPAIKGKSADDIQNHIATSPKHAGFKKLTPEEVKDLAAFLATLK